MPLFGNRQTFEDVYAEAKKSAVSIYRIADQTQVGCGFVVHAAEKQTVVAMHSSFLEDFEPDIPGQGFFVKFFNDVEGAFREVEVIDQGPDSMALLVVYQRLFHWTEVKYGQIQEPAELLLTIAPCPGDIGVRPKRFPGYIMSPRCTADFMLGDPIERTEDEFAFYLPVRSNSAPVMLGAPIYNMDKQFVGWLNEIPEHFADLRLGIRAEVFQRHLNTWMGGRTWDEILQEYVSDFDF